MSFETSPPEVETNAPILSVPEQPPEQEWQTSNPEQVRQERTIDNPPTRGVSQRRALEGKLAPEQQAVFTPASTVDELVKAAYFVAASIDAPVVDVISQHQINLHYPADGSLVTVRVEGRPGAWGGIGPHGTAEEEAERNEHYDAMKAAGETAPPPEALAQREAHDDAHAREDAKPQEPRSE